MTAIEVIALINALPEPEKKQLVHLVRTSPEGISAFQIMNHGSSNNAAR